MALQCGDCYICANFDRYVYTEGNAPLQRLQQLAEARG